MRRFTKVVVCRLYRGIVTETTIWCTAKPILKMVRKLVVDVKELVMLAMNG